MPSVPSLASGNICLKLKSDSQGAFNPHHKRPSHWARSSPPSKISPSTARIPAACSSPASPRLRSPAAASYSSPCPRPPLPQKARVAFRTRAGSFHPALPQAQCATLAWAGPEPRAAFLGPGPSALGSARVQPRQPPANSYRV